MQIRCQLFGNQLDRVNVQFRPGMILNDSCRSGQAAIEATKTRTDHPTGSSDPKPSVASVSYRSGLRLDFGRVYACIGDKGRLAGGTHEQACVVVARHHRIRTVKRWGTNHEQC